MCPWLACALREPQRKSVTSQDMQQSSFRVQTAGAHSLRKDSLDERGIQNARGDFSLRLGANIRQEVTFCFRTLNQHFVALQKMRFIIGPTFYSHIGLHIFGFVDGANLSSNAYITRIELRFDR